MLALCKHNIYHVLERIRRPQQSATFMSINITTLASRLNIDRMTVGRWIRRYNEYLSPPSNPYKGKSRILNDTDVRVLYLVATLRDTGISHDEIIQRLDELQADGWQQLPEVPPEWDVDDDQTITTSQAASRAYELAQVAVLQTELQHTRQSLELAQSRLKELESQLETVSGEKDELIQQKHAREQEFSQQKHTLELEVSQAKGEVSRLEAQLTAYSMTYSLGGNKPVSPVWIILVTALTAVVLTIVTVAIVFLLT